MVANRTWAAACVVWTLVGGCGLEEHHPRVDAAVVAGGAGGAAGRALNDTGGAARRDLNDTGGAAGAGAGDQPLGTGAEGGTTARASGGAVGSSGAHSSGGKGSIAGSDGAAIGNDGTAGGTGGGPENLAGDAGDSSSTARAGTAGAAGESTAGQSSAGTGGSNVSCPAPAQFSFLDGFEAYPSDTVLGVPGSPWRALNPSSTTGSLTTVWARSCAKDLFLQAAGPILYAPLSLASRPSKLNIELWYAPAAGADSAAEFGLGSIDGQILSKAFAISVQGGSAKASTSSGPSSMVSTNVQSASDTFGRAAQNYIRVELDYCELEARVYVGTDSDAPLSATVGLGANDNFDIFYLAPEARSTYIDNLAIWTPATPIDRSQLCAGQLLDTFTSPGSRCSGLGWDGNNLWLLDNLEALYQLDDTGKETNSVALDFHGDGLSWDGVGFWTRNNDSASFGTQIVRVRANGTVDSGPDIFAQQGFSDWDSQAQWYDGSFWTLSSQFGVHKWSTAGVEQLNWTTSELSPVGLLAKGDALYFGVGIWRNSADYDTGVAKYSLTGVPLGSFDLAQLGVPNGLGRLSLASDGQTYWVCSEDGFDVWHVALPF